ncbi:non-ribosomal peptide synthetase [Amycolatopsis sp. NBC_00438]|uniref:non-ribosomal peptide synthetase n=1 Tax=Amycolatopsis sp. NBC_00438 TaxID=2903558 RepID=UPI002E1C2E5F|nr:non-ribosomal peptide synthetase [Amycolatopsis sp. NBC_00438]
MIETRRPATAEQTEVWLAMQREPESARFTIPLDLEFTPGVDVAALRIALGDLVERHPNLRSAFVADGSELVQVVHHRPPVPFVEHRRPGRYDRAAALEWAAAIAAQPFDLGSAPLVRGTLLHADDGALFVLAVHHVVSDGWSQGIVARDLVHAYRERVAGRLPWDAPLAIAESAESAESTESTDSTVEVPDSELTAYWSGLLADQPPSLAPIADRNRPGSVPGPAGFREAVLTEDVLERVRAVARERLASPATVVLSAWLTLLHAWSAGADGTTGMLFASRTPDDEERVDLLARVLPVRSRLDFTESFGTLVDRVRDQVLDSLEHSAVPSARLRDIRRDGGASLIDNSVFMYFPEQELSWTEGDTTIRVVEHETTAGKYDLSLAALEGEAHIRLRVDHDTLVYRDSTAEVLLAQLVKLLTDAVADPGATCGALVAACDPFVPARPVTETAPVNRVLLHDMVRRQAELRPDAVAVRYHDEVLTYAGLVARAGAVANWLRAEGLGAESLVALLLPPGPASVVFWLGTLMAGAAYLPLDPAYPDAQLQMVIDDARPRLVVGAPGFVERVRLPKCPIYLVDEALAEAARHPGTPPEVAIDPATAFNVLYTSGSTGRPKGVVWPHAGFIRLLDRPDFVPLHHTDVVSQLSPLNFDGATYEVWGALTHGAELVIFDKELTLSPPELRTAFRERGITTLIVSSPLLNRLIEDVPDLFPGLRRVYFGGEIVSVPHLEKALRWSAPGTMLHSYGPTENSFTTTWTPITEIEENARTLSIGRVVPETDGYVVFDHTTMRQAPRGVPGELLLGGTGVTRGYLGNPRETARRFIPDPYSGVPGARLYRTGDRVRWLPDGRLEFIGRNDNQVKIRSQRVELGEVESALAAHASVEAAFVTVCLNSRKEKEIAAYVVLGAGGTVEELRRHAREVLPVFAVPRYLVPLDRMPLTPNGKIDRRRLPEAADAPAAPARVPAPAAAAVVPAAESTVDLVRAAWAELLEHDTFAMDDNFFDVGGHSLILVKLQANLRSRFTTAPSIGELLRHTTVRAQVALLANVTPVDRPATAVSSAGAPASTTPATLVSSGAQRESAAAPAAAAEVPAESAPGGAQAVGAAASEPAAGGAQVVGAAASEAATGGSQVIAVSTASEPATGGSQVIAVSAASEAALAEARRRLADHLTTAPDVDLAQVAATLDRGRERFPHRFAVVATDPATAAAALRAGALSTGPVAAGVVDRTRPVRLVFAFGAGAGSSARTFAAQHALVTQLTGHGAAPDVVTGSGAGHLTAAVAAGVLTHADGLRLATALDNPGTLAAALEAVTFTPPAVALAAPDGVTPAGRPLDARLWAKHLTYPAEATELLATATGGRPAVVVDLGGDEFLAAASTRPELTAVSSTGPTALAQLWCSGVEIRLTDPRTGRVRLPGYPFARPGTTTPAATPSAERVRATLTAAWQNLAGEQDTFPPDRVPQLHHRLRLAFDRVPDTTALSAAEDFDGLANLLTETVTALTPTVLPLD